MVDVRPNSNSLLFGIEDHRIRTDGVHRLT
jgi:hypothetical protein